MTTEQKMPRLTFSKPPAETTASETAQTTDKASIVSAYDPLSKRPFWHPISVWLRGVDVL